MGSVRHEVVSMPCAFGSSGTVSCWSAAAAALASEKTTLAEESLTHTTVLGGASPLAVR
jgi:hypothetical protein